MFRLLSAALMVIVFAQVGTVEAVSADSIIPRSALDISGDCTAFAVEVDITNRVASTADAGVLDYYYLVVYDGNGNAHYSDDFAAQVPSTSPAITASIDATYHNPVSTFPLQIVMFDVDTGGVLPLSTVEAAPVVSSATYTPDCADSTTIRSSASTDDDRENTLSAFPYQPVAIYCKAEGRIDIYGVNDTSEGYLLISATAEEINTIGVNDVQNLLIARADDVRLFRLTTGEFQVNAALNDDPNGYVFTWEGCFG